MILGFSEMVSGSNERSKEAFQPGKDGWISLFDGVQIRGWKTAPKSDWAVKDGLLTGTNGEILNRWCWKNFEMSTLFRGMGTVRFRAGSNQIGHTGFNQPGYRLDLNQGILSAQGNQKITDIPRVLKKDDWNELQIRAIGGNLTISLNGKTIAEAKDCSSLEKGRIGFIADGKHFQIKRLRARPLGDRKKDTLPADNYFCYTCHSNF